MKKVLRAIHKWLYKQYLTYQYADCPDDVCCCGEMMPTGYRSGCLATCRSVKEFTMTKAIERKFPNDPV